MKRMIKPKGVYRPEKFKPLEGFSIDSRTIKKGQGFVAVKGKLFDGHDFIPEAQSRGAACIICQRSVGAGFKPALKVPFLVVEDSYQALISIASYIREKKKPFVYAITGSLGKTTTKEMLYFLLEGHCRVLKNKKTENNLLGVVKTIFSLNHQEVVIAELGTNQPGEIGVLSGILKPDVGVITFVKPVHLEGLSSLEGIFREKISLGLSNPAMKLVLNRDDAYLRRVKDKKNVYWFGTKSNNHLFARRIAKDSQNCWFRIQNAYELAIPNHLEGFITNVLAAVLSGHLYGIPIEKLVSKIKGFKKYPLMRMQIQKTARFSILNDAYNANPYSVKQALNSLKNHPLKKIAVIGDMLELGKKTAYYHRCLAPYLVKNKFDYCLTLGDYTRQLNRRLSQIGYKRAYHFSSHRDLARFINQKIVPLKNQAKQYLIFLKGSRKMELEKIIPYLK
ncbi:MAG: UDP-N-acetylmuramoyl-tripeptide--D-alanyl-D-alanine ligase [Candidatus Omnitrophica bacterium]|nr:UDP-N-acetylmuramoyl-tripeptide--D-alanyl-D-alanine ligase [Candidatus Omnitrophota bacterium]MBU2044835.1 UDP-N-acetylmuramoyl-tripeptide--D-alanyl-D-alanine ligase [Candidatus Omnitrophota bacterium]